MDFLTCYSCSYYSSMVSRNIFTAMCHVNDTHSSVQEFPLLYHQLISMSSILFSHIKEYRYLKNVIHKIDRNEWLLLSARLTAKI